MIYKIKNDSKNTEINNYLVEQSKCIYNSILILHLFN